MKYYLHIDESDGFVYIEYLRYLESMMTDKRSEEEYQVDSAMIMMK